MAGAGYKLFNTGDVLTAAQVNTYLQEQVVMVFANAAARTTALSGVLAEGMVSFLKDTDSLEIYSGSAWVAYGSGDITGITTGATSGLTGGVTSGTADLKFNTTAKGGLLVGTGSGTVSELTVGSNNQVLTADSATATGLKWASAASGGGFTLIETLSLSGSSTTSSTIPGTYKHLHIQVRDVYFSANDTFFIRLNNDTGSNYWCYGLRIDAVNSSISGQYDTGVTVFTLCDLGNNSGALTRGVGSFWLWRYTDTSNVVKIDSTFNGYIAGNYRSMYEQGFYDNSAAITSITFRAGTGSTTFSAGTAYIYGVS